MGLEAGKQQVSVLFGLLHLPLSLCHTHTTPMTMEVNREGSIYVHSFGSCPLKRDSTRDRRVCRNT